MGLVYTIKNYHVYNPTNRIIMNDQTRPETATVQGNDKFRMLFDTIEDSVIIFEIDTYGVRGLIQDVNKATIERLGYNKEELLGMTVMDLAPPESPAIHGPAPNLFSSGAALYETVHQTKSGASIPIEVNARTFEYENQMLVLAICRDISSRKKAQDLQEEYKNRLESEVEKQTADINRINSDLTRQIKERKFAELKARETENSLKALIDASHQSIFMIKPDGTLLYVNKSIAGNLGSTPKQMIGTNIYDYLPKELASSRKAKLEEAIISQESVKVMDVRDGKPIFHIIYPIVENGSVNRVAVYAEDLSELFSKERELEHSRHIRSVLFEIMNYAQETNDLEDLLESIHHIMLQELRAENFFVALIDEEREELRFEYCLDKKAPYCQTITDINDHANKRLSLLPIRNNEIVHLSKPEILEMQNEGTIDFLGQIPEVWLGVPMRIRGNPIGVLVIKDYETPEKYSEEDIQLFAACSDQIAIAIERKKFDLLSQSGRDIFNNIPAGLLIFRFTEPDMLHLVDANPIAGKIFQIDHNSSKGLRIDEIWRGFLEEDLFKKLISPIKAGWKFFTGEIPHPGKNQNGILKLRSFRLPDSRLGIVFEDITDQKAAEAMIKESEEQFRALFEDNHTVMCIIDPASGKILDTNKAAENMYGMTKSELCAHDIYELNTLTQEEINAAMQRARIRNQKTFIFKHRIADGGVRDVEVFSGPFQFKGKTRLISIIHDITDRLKSQKELAKAKEAAISANKAKDEFLANISHEIRTPLNGVMGMLQLLHRSDLGCEQQQSVDIALQSSRNLLRVLDDILDLSKMEVGTMKLFEEPFILKGLLDECLNLFRFQAKQKDVELRYEMSPEAENCYLGDEGRLRQILFNLLGNALKFTESGSVKLIVESFPTENPDLKHLHFKVTDTGIGIPEDKIESIFESFTQVDGSLSRQYKGAGLGLSIVKRLIKLMNGEIEVESRMGHGTSISFTLPLLITEAPLQASENTAQTSSAGPLKIMLVEDERVNRMMACRILEKMGHRIICAENGQECLRVLRDEQFDVILMDIQMPVMDGIETTRIIRTTSECRKYRDIPIVALSAHAHVDNRRIAREAGMNGYISKPFEWDDLANTLDLVTVN